jgi:hypothetical protein
MAPRRLPKPGEKVLYVPSLRLGTVLEVQEQSATVLFKEFRAPVTVHIEKILPVSRRSKALAKTRRLVERRSKTPGTDPPPVELRGKADRRLVERREIADSEPDREP